MGSSVSLPQFISISLTFPPSLNIYASFIVITLQLYWLVGQTGPEGPWAKAARGLQGGPPAACKPPLLP